MKKRYLYMIILVLLVIIQGCSDNQEEFDDGNIIFEVVNTDETNEYKSYMIEITNNTGFQLTHLSFTLNYPIKTPNGSKSNPYVLEGSTSSNRPINLNSRETITFSIIAPMNEVFADSTVFDFKNPNIDLKGYYLDGKEEIPFGISGGLSVIVN